LYDTNNFINQRFRVLAVTLGISSLQRSTKALRKSTSAE